MSALTSNVSTGKPAVGGAIYTAPLTSTLTLPTSATASLASAFKGLGYVSEDGLVNSNKAESESIKAWGGDVVETSQTSKEDKFTFTLIEAMNKDVLGVVHGEDNVTGSALSTGLSVKVNATALTPHAWVVDMVLKGDTLKRIVIPNAVVSEVGDVTYKDDEAIGYEVTLTAMPDSAQNTHYEYMQTRPTSPGGT